MATARRAPAWSGRDAPGDLPVRERTTALAWLITFASWVEKMKVVPSLLVDLLHQVDDVLAGGRIQVRRRLVREHELGSGHERARDGHALALTTGELVGAVFARGWPAPPARAGSSPAPALGGSPACCCSKRGNSTFWKTLSTDTRLKLWKMNPMVFRRRSVSCRSVSVLGVVTVRPPRRPSVAVSTQPMRLSRVVLPLPDGPAMEMNSSGWTSRRRPEAPGPSACPGCIP